MKGKGPPPGPALDGPEHTRVSGVPQTPAPVQTDKASTAKPLGAAIAAVGGVPKAKAAPPAWPLHAGLLLPQRGAARAADARLKGALTAGGGSSADDSAAASDGGRDDDPAYAAPPASKPRRRGGPGRPPKSRMSGSAKGGAAAGVAKSAMAQRSGSGSGKGKGQVKGKASKQKAAAEQPAVCSRGRPIADVLAEQKVRMPAIPHLIHGVSFRVRRPVHD